MSLLSKILNGKKPSLSDVVELIQGKEKKPDGQTQKPAQNSYTQPAHYAQPAYSEHEPEETPLGRSWGEKMPKEPNQYNYPGIYREYFEDIFSKDFPDLTVYREPNPRSTKASAYSFFRGTQKVLVVELLSRSCDVYQVRNACRRSGTPYLRFYYDYEGWWNARSYVVNRMRKALGD